MHYINCFWTKHLKNLNQFFKAKDHSVKEYDNLYLVKYVKGKSDMKDTDEVSEELYLQKIQINFYVFHLKNQLIMISIIISFRMVMFQKMLLLKNLLMGQ